MEWAMWAGEVVKVKYISERKDMAIISIPGNYNKVVKRSKLREITEADVQELHDNLLNRLDILGYGEPYSVYALAAERIRAK